MVTGGPLIAEPTITGPVVARALPDVSGFQRELDYLVPEAMVSQVRVGTVVRAPLQGRRVRAWVTALPAQAAEGVSLRPLAKVTGWGPEPELLGLATWAAWRWWGRRRSFLATATALTAVPVLPGPLNRPRRDRPRYGGDGPEHEVVPEAWGRGTAVVRLPPGYRAIEVVLAALDQARHAGQAGPLLVIAPTHARAEAGQAALARRDVTAALLPDDWALARGGAGDVVIGTRAAAWGPCPGMAGVVVLDAHDESLAQGQAPTWDAPTVAVERARRAQVPCLLVSPCPTLELLGLAGGEAVHVARSAERTGWAPLTVIDAREQDPRSGLYPPPIVEAIRGEGRVACVLNRKGRAHFLACASCGSTATCEQCGSAVHLDSEVLGCHRCGATRPVVCSQCGSVRLRSLRLGVTRVREQLETLAGKPVGEVTELTPGVPDEPVLVGTEALLHREGPLRRAGGVSTVIFLDFDQEVLAPRYRAGEEALALLARASRLVGGRAAQGRLLVQTRVPGHPVIDAAVRADPGVLADYERPVRQALRLPPYGGLAHVSGPGAADLVRQLEQKAAEPGHHLEMTDSGSGTWVLKAPTFNDLSDALAGIIRPAERVRVEVGPVRA